MKKLLMLMSISIASMLSAATGFTNHDTIRYRADATDSNGLVHRFYIEAGETSSLIPTATGDIAQIAIEPATAPDTGVPSNEFVDVSDKQLVEIKDGKVQQ